MREDAGVGGLPGEEGGCSGLLSPSFGVKLVAPWVSSQVLKADLADFSGLPGRFAQEAWGRKGVDQGCSSPLSLPLRPGRIHCLRLFVLFCFFLQTNELNSISF